jgi:hypothetical protein
MPEIQHRALLPRARPMLKFVLLPFVFIIGCIGTACIFVMGSGIQHQLNWAPTNVTVLRAESLCKLTYQPADALLRETAAIEPCERIGDAALPAGASKARVFKEERGALAYEIDGTQHYWEGKLSDAGVYNVKAGDALTLLYDPQEPNTLDAAEMKGWRGGLLLTFVCVLIVSLYTWFFWFRSEPPAPKSPRLLQPLRKPLPPPFGAASNGRAFRA